MRAGRLRWSEAMVWKGRALGARLFSDARGLQTLEWVALAVVILALLGAVAAYICSHPDVVGGAVPEAIRSFFARLTETFGPILSPFFPFPFPGGPPNA